MNKQYLQDRGWTESNLRDRMQGCRDGLKEVDRTKPSAWTYRAMFVSLYLKYKHWLSVLKAS